jgi:hypothetical protein
MQPHRTRAQLARLAALPRNARWAPVRPAAPTWRESAAAFAALVALFVATEVVVAALGGAR